MEVKTLGSTVYSICHDCAKANGAVWPECHCATFWPGECDVCHKPKSLCDVSDYNWPKGKRPKTFSLERRD
jgi:hypothetical protein